VYWTVRAEFSTRSNRPPTIMDEPAWLIEYAMGRYPVLTRFGVNVAAVVLTRSEWGVLLASAVVGNIASNAIAPTATPSLAVKGRILV
jgi:hypothetical protein